MYATTALQQHYAVKNICWGGTVVQHVEYRTYNQRVAGSTAGRGTAVY